MSSTNLTVGISQIYPCNYLSGQQEQLLVVKDSVDDYLFEQLLALGFRRNGDAIYRPHCPHCQACLPIRIPVNRFNPSKRQKRTLAKNKHLHWQVTTKVGQQHYPLYEKYITQRHFDGPMFPATPTQFSQFLTSSWMHPRYIELYQHDTLIAVAVTDVLPHSFSAIYTYFDPDFENRSLGSLMILLQCRLANIMGKSFLYLGYQIEGNKKMSYKRLYRPYEILTAQGWQQNI